MVDVIKENLTRQHKAFMLLAALLQEEFSRLQKSNPQGVSQIELSIHELLRQLMTERTSLRGMVKRISPEAERVRDLSGIVPDDVMADYEAILKSMDDAEQTGARQAAKNYQLALGLYDQSNGMLKFLHDELQPKPKNAYTNGGRYVAPRDNGPSLIRGRL